MRDGQRIRKRAGQGRGVARFSGLLGLFLPGVPARPDPATVILPFFEVLPFPRDFKS
jgi:hypothetical protein